LHTGGGFVVRRETGHTRKHTTRTTQHTEYRREGSEYRRGALSLARRFALPQQVPDLAPAVVLWSPPPPRALPRPIYKDTGGESVRVVNTGGGLRRLLGGSQCLTYMLNTRSEEKNTVFYSCSSCLVNALTLNTRVFMPYTGYTRRNTLFVLLWLRHRNTRIPIQHVGC